MLIHFATSPGIPALTRDDRIAADVLQFRGVRVEPLIWSGARDEPGWGTVAPGSGARTNVSPARPTRADAVVIRSCWDYHLHEAAFRAWIAGLESDGVQLINPAALVRWNLHKSYIAELPDHDVAVVPTVFIRTGDGRGLREILEAAGWREAVVKPAVSLSAWETWRVARREADAHEDRFVQLRTRADVLVQEFLPEVTRAGEWSLMFFGPRFSHAVRKLPKPGDFRVQTEHGGSVTLETPPQQVIEAAERVLKVLPEPPVYCRIDGIESGDNFVVMEVECIDPVLFFALHAPAAQYFADEIVNRLTRSRE